MSSLKKSTVDCQSTIVNKKGFTLIELLVVISILSILVGLGTSTWLVAQQKGRDDRRKGDITQIKSALQLYFEQNKSFPPPASSPPAQAVYASDSGTNWIPNLFESGLMQKIPRDPKQGGLVTSLASVFPILDPGQVQQTLSASLAQAIVGAINSKKISENTGALAQAQETKTLGAKDTQNQEVIQKGVTQEIKITQNGLEPSSIKAQAGAILKLTNTSSNRVYLKATNIKDPIIVKTGTGIYWTVPPISGTLVFLDLQNQNYKLEVSVQ